MKETQTQRRARHHNERLAAREALAEIRELVSKRQLPITDQVYRIAERGLGATE